MAKYTKTSKKRYFARLRSESLILSCLDGIAARLIAFLKVSFLFIFFGNSESTDKKLEESTTGGLAERFKLRNRFLHPMKLKLSAALEHSSLSKEYGRLVNRLLYTGVGTYGIYFVTLGLYTGLSFFVKRYAFGASAANIYALLNGGVIVVLSLPLLLVRKPLVRFIGESTFCRRVFADCIDIDSYNEPKKYSAAGTALILGSLSGALVFFCGEGRFLLFLVVTVFVCTVLFSPEIGLCSVAFIFPFASRTLVIAIADLTLFSYVIKVLRGKRNFKFNAAGVFSLIFAVSLFAAFANGGGQRAHFAFCAVALCLMTANLALSYELIKKLINAMCLGFGVVVLIFGFQTAMSAWGGLPWQTAITDSVSVFDSGSTLAKYCLLMLPFFFCKLGKSSLLTSPLGLLSAAASLSYCVFIGKPLLAVFIAGASALYLAVCTKRLVGPVVTCFGIPIGCMYFASLTVNFGTLNAAPVVSRWGEALKICAEHLFTGIGMSEKSLAVSGLTDSRSMYIQTLAEGGITGFLLLFAALFFLGQRLYASLSPVGSEGRRVAAAASTAALTGLFLGTADNLWDNSAICIILWLALGLVSAAYEVRKEEKRGKNDEEI